MHLEPVIYKSKLLDSKCFASLVLDAFLKPLEKYGVFLVALISLVTKLLFHAKMQDKTGITQTLASWRLCEKQQFKLQ